ncbi:MAG: hypothetical protein ACLGI6_07660, partial [Gammaproteobacteria bacterium]
AELLAQGSSRAWSPDGQVALITGGCTVDALTWAGELTAAVDLATALINPPVQVMVTNHFQDQGAHALGLLTCIQYGFAGMGTMLVSSLPFQPSANFTISTFAFIVLSLVGFVWASPRPVAQT